MMLGSKIPRIAGIIMPSSVDRRSKEIASGVPIGSTIS
jgi:hypothetical protein